MRTTRRADEREIVLGESGGNMLWNDFIIRERCGGVVGDGGGKEANTNYFSLLLSRRVN
jgi:hypothetical protein